MKQAFAVLSLTLFAALALFGLALTAHGMSHSGDCLASIAKGVRCPLVMTGAELASMHSRFFESFTSATFPSLLAALLVAAFSLMLHARTRFTAPLQHRSLPDAARDRRTSYREPFLSWLSRLEMSPTLV